MDPADAKGKAAQLFLDIYRADKRLHGVLPVDAARPLVEASVTWDMMSARVVFQGAQLFDALLSRRVPTEPLLQALVILEPRAGKLNVAVRQPAEVQRLTAEERGALARRAPPSSSEFLKDMDRKAVPQVIREARRAGSRRQLVLAGLIVVSVAGIALAFFMAPKTRLEAAHAELPADGIPCTKLRSANGFLFCVVDEPKLAALDDDAIHTRMKLTQAAAAAQSFKQVAFLRQPTADGIQHRYKPLLWEPDPVKPVAATKP